MRNYLKLFMLSGVLGAVSSIFAQSVVFNDDFSGNLSQWHFYGGTSSTALTISASAVSAPMSGNVLASSGGSSTWTYSMAQWSTTSLASIGDKVTFSFDVQLLGTTSVSNCLDITFFNTVSTMSGNYFVSTNSNPTPFSDSDGLNIRQYYSTASNGLAFASISDDVSTSLGTTASLTNIGSGNLVYGVSLTLTRVSGGLQLTYISAGNTYNYLYASPATYDFNSLMLRMGNASGGKIDNVAVTFTAVPELSVVFLLLIGAGGLAIGCKKFSKLQTIS